MTFGGILGIWFIFFGAGSFLMARTAIAVTPGLLAFYITFSIATSFVFATIWWIVLGPLSYTLIAVLALSLLASSVYLSKNKKKYTQISISSVLLAVLCLLAIFWVFLVDDRQPYAFDTWDAVVSWNRWARELLHGEYRPFKNPYPILWPTLWSIVYAAQGTEFMQIWTKNAHLIIIVLTSLVVWELGYRKSILAAFVFATAVLLNTDVLLTKFTHGYMDEPVALLIALGVVSFFLFEEREPVSYEEKLVWLLPFWLIGIAAITKQAGWPIIFIGLVIAIYDYMQRSVSKNIFVFGLVGLLMPIAVFFILFATKIGAVSSQAGTLEVLAGLSAKSTAIEGSLQRGVAWFASVDSRADVIRLMGVIAMFISLFFVHRRVRLIIALTAILVVLGSVGTGICCSYDERNSKWLLALSIAGLSGVLANIHNLKVANWSNGHGENVERLEAMAHLIKRPLAKIDNRIFFIVLPFLLLSASVVERVVHPYLRKSMDTMQTLGGKEGALALKEELEKIDKCAVIFSIYPMVKHNPLLVEHKPKFKGAGDLNWYLHSGKSINHKCNTYWYLKPGIYSQASAEDKQLFKNKIENGEIVQLGGYAYRIQE